MGQSPRTFTRCHAATPLLLSALNPFSHCIQHVTGPPKNRCEVPLKFPTLSRLQHTCRIITTVQCLLEWRTDAPLRGIHTLDTFSMRQSIHTPVTIHGANIRQTVPYPAGSPPVQACPVSHSGKIRTGTDHYHRVLCAAFPDALRL